jgi:hypothetical protein
MFRKLWDDQSGAILSAELVVLGTIMVVGVATGLASIRDAVITELNDFATVVSTMDQSLVVHGVTSHSGATGRTLFVDTPDAGDTGSTGASSTCLIVCGPAPSLAGSESGAGPGSVL